MSFIWPTVISLLVLIPLLIIAYIWITRRRRRVVVRYSSLSLIRAAGPSYSWIRRHLPFVLFLFGVAGLVTAMSRPVTVVSVPTNQTTIILALDVSGSMCADDIEPNRLIAAKDAALSFIRQQEAGTQIGIVAFAGFAELILPPTNDQQQLEEAVRNLTINRRTAIGSAILKSIDAISEIDTKVAPAVDVYSSGPAPTPVPSGAYAPAIIVLLTDGASNAGPFPLDAAEQAVDRGVRVYTIGFGTAQGGQRNCNPTITNGSTESTGYNGGGFGGGGGRWRRGIDEETLQEVADMSGGTYYAPESAIELHEVFEDLPTHLIMKHETAEISVLFVALSTLLVGAAMILALVWNPLF